MNPTLKLELEVLPGLETLGALEWREVMGWKAVKVESGKLQAEWRTEGLLNLKKLRIIRVAYLVVTAAGKKPSALRGEALWGAFERAFREVRRGGDFLEKSYRLKVKGDQSKEIQRLGAEIEKRLALKRDGEKGEQLFRVRKSPHSDGWELLARMTPKPLSVRGYRVIDYRGALDGTLAAAAVRLLSIKDRELVLDPFSGSGTLLFELVANNHRVRCVGVEREWGVLEYCSKNLKAFKGASQKEWPGIFLQSDARRLPIKSKAFDKLITNLPWGEAVGKKRKLKELYSGAAHEIERVLKPGAPCLFVTQAKEEFEQSFFPAFRLEQHFQVYTGTFRPHLFLCRKLEK